MSQHMIIAPFTPSRRTPLDGIDLGWAAEGVRVRWAADERVAGMGPGQLAALGAANPDRLPDIGCRNLEAWRALIDAACRALVRVGGAP